MEARTQSSKPTVFFSHSSKDKEVLARLKEVFVEKTGKTIDVFLSSDGQSIPLGRNWSHRVEQALEEAKIMVVFLTPNSISSQWIYFEAGYAHSRGIRVIPVGFLGFDLGTANPPLSLLQGFNIRSFEGLNNLIAVSNSEFNYAHKESFDSQKYENILGSFSSKNSSEGLSQYADDIVEISTTCQTAQDNKEPSPEMIDGLEKLFRKNHPVVFLKKDNLKIPGLSLSIHGDQMGMGKTRLTISISPSAFQKVLPLVQEIFRSFNGNGSDSVDLTFTLADHLEVVQTDHRVSGLLTEYPITYDEDGTLVLGHLAFTTGRYHNHRSGAGRSYVRVFSKNSDLSSDEVARLFEILIKSGVIRVNAPISL